VVWKWERAVTGNSHTNPSLVLRGLPVIYSDIFAISVLATCCCYVFVDHMDEKVGCSLGLSIRSLFRLSHLA
jgi:hypothetical protein